ncbi:peptide chain release factor N(5)-glutamine methyltransferase [Chamaesiphon sp. OTE_20_metabat_361]|uniref:peptide chain release factor N(5)-glutamine methyltransferase n=1 Tax=Chamaesiphon sp. OTE_20_metabat_361 TaxID=2964689 RepID=UPI00286BA98E|nr:peptide chain release factor N(5)-glutamine methyltransferase [Chamaesiphon sp. OTE_20_metabat_361]
MLVNGRELWAWRRWAISLAKLHQIEVREIDWLLQSISDLDRLTLRLESIGNEESIELEMSLDRLSILWLDRVEHNRPVQYLVGKTFWREFELIVSPAVLIPRPETEMTIDIALTKSNHTQQQGIWVDLGTGSGAIAIGLAATMPTATIYAVDCSAAALEIAQINATRLAVSDRIQFHHGSWWSPLPQIQGKVAGMLSNPPYIPSEEVLRLHPEVCQHEPHLALDGGSDGLAALRILVDTAPHYLQAGGIWLVEMMAGQGAIVAELLAQQGSYTDIEIIDDLAGLDRFAFARLRG